MRTESMLAHLVKNTPAPVASHLRSVSNMVLLERHMTSI
jgi:hypothetical protein